MRADIQTHKERQTGDHNTPHPSYRGRVNSMKKFPCRTTETQLPRDDWQKYLNSIRCAIGNRPMHPAVFEQELIGRWDTRTWRRSILLPLLRITPPTEVSPGPTSVKFYTEVKGWLRYRMANKYCRNFQHPEYRAHERYRRQTDLPLCDSKDQNVT